MKKRVFWHQLGCTKNQVDSEKIIYNVSQNIEIVDDVSVCDFVIINTCGFIEDAKKQSLDDIFDFVEIKKEYPNIKLFVIGCLVERYITQLKEDIPEVDEFFTIKNYDKLEEILNENTDSKDEILEPYHYSLNESSDVYYVKISEGCNNHCSYCAIPLIRGSFRAFSVEEIIEEVKFGLSLGYKEIVLIGQDLAFYNYDNYNLPKLMQKILDEVKEYFWLRIMYLHPRHLDPIKEEIAQVMKNDERVCRYLDIPVQHISDSILEKMNRRHNGKLIIDMINYFKEELPDMVFRSSIIVGFPGETEENFNELLNFVKAGYIDRLGFFGYSKEDDTKAYNFENEVDEKIINDRLAKLEDAQYEVMLDKNDELIDREVKVLIEEMEAENTYIGRSAYEAPEIDNLYHIVSETELEIGEFYNCKIIETDLNDYFAEIV